MNANELRLGNYVQQKVVNAPEDYTLLTAVRLAEFEEIHNGSTKYLPIPISKDWLKNLGFAFDEGLMFYSIEANKGKLRGTLASDVLMVSLGDVFVRVKYVHQLQNLYNSLTGKELVSKVFLKG
jgi:hypothetical protein